jgi:hypothetical protein
VELEALSDPLPAGEVLEESSADALPGAVAVEPAGPPGCIVAEPLGDDFGDAARGLPEPEDVPCSEDEPEPDADDPSPPA